MTPGTVFGAVARIPAWEPHPDVWLLVGLMAVAYPLAVARLGPRLAPRGTRAATGLQVACWYLGVLATWLAVDWPLDAVAERSLYSAHMVQHLVLMLVAAPLLVLGTPGWLLRWLLRPEPVLAVVRWAARFVPAILLYNIVLVFMHWPAVVNASLRSEPFHLFLHGVMFLTSLVVWLPVLSPLPEIPRLAPIGRMLFLFLQSVVPTVPASFLTFGTAPLYHSYEHLGHLWGLSTLTDQRIAGLIMKLGAGLVIWAVIAVVFFRWAAEEESRNLPGRRWQDLDRELTESGLRTG